MASKAWNLDFSILSPSDMCVGEICRTHVHSVLLPQSQGYDTAALHDEVARKFPWDTTVAERLMQRDETRS